MACHLRRPRWSAIAPSTATTRSPPIRWRTSWRTAGPSAARRSRSPRRWRARRAARRIRAGAPGLAARPGGRAAAQGSV